MANATIENIVNLESETERSIRVEQRSMITTLKRLIAVFLVAAAFDVVRRVNVILDVLWMFSRQSGEK